MNNTFNGQINISRDLRANKQTVLGKRDLLDIIFLVTAVGSAILIAYLLGFKLKIIDETLSVIIGLIPMVIILALGFRKKAGIRYIFYLSMNFLSKCKNSRTNRENINKVLDIEKKVSIASIKQDKKGISIKSIFEILISKNKVKNTGIKTDIVKIRKKPIIDKAILVLDVNIENLEEFVKTYLENKLVNRVQIRVKKDKAILLLELNYSYRDFLKKYIKNEFKTIGIKINKKETIKEFTKRIREKINYRLKIVRKYYTKYSKFLNLSSFNKDFMPNELYDIYDDIKTKNIQYIDINDEYINSLNIKNKKVNLLHIYKSNEYREIINEAKNEAEVVIYVLRKEEKIFLATFFVLDKEKEINTRKLIILNKLEKEQGVAISQCLYYMYNPFNNYRVYKEN